MIGKQAVLQVCAIARNRMRAKGKSRMEIKIKLPEKVKIILERLMVNGFEGYAVGGCVRDSLLGR